jgi:DNA helicase-2/ATP-dependent DNA helicase PcrA
MAETSHNLMKKLNSEQKASVLATEGAVRVAAGAGTGKTMALTSRYCYLISELGIAPKNILCATFTNRAANEMKRRVRDALGDMDLGYICTFHAFCVQLLKEDINTINFPRNFIIIDEEDQKQMLLKIFREMNLTLRDMTLQRAKDEILEARKMYAADYIDDIYLLDNEELKKKASEASSRNSEIFYRYLYEQKKNFACDFNDLINFATYILEKFPDVREKWQERMQYVMVDEFQDVSLRQYKIARILAAKHGNLFIVGDPDQTIYSWRGSHVKYFLDFPKVYKNALTFALTTNYRSTPEILATSNTLISKNEIRFPKELRSVKSSGARPLYYHAASEKAEAAWIYSEIKKLLKSGVKEGSIAVLYRAHYLTRVVEECFIKNGLSYRIFSGVEFYGRREIKDVICYLRMVTASDDIAFLRTVNMPPRKIGTKKIDALKKYADGKNISLYSALKENIEEPLWHGTQAKRYVTAIEYVRRQQKAMKLGDALQTLLDMSGYEEFLRLQSDQERLDNVAELKRSVEEMGQDDDATLEDFLARAALFTDLDHEERHNAVKLMTVHTAKGMEFPYVFVCGLNEGVFPSRKTDTPEDMDEERRLAYVAMTRAMDGLYLSDAEGVANDNIFKYPSRFIFDAGKENIDYVKELDKTLEERAKRQIKFSEAKLQSHAELFEEGDRVTHTVFGEGTVISVNTSELCYSIQFDKLKTSRSVLFGTNLKKTQK